MSEKGSTLGRDSSLSCEREQRSKGVCLNLQGLTFAESRAIELLRGLRREGIPLLGRSPLIEGLLAANEVSANAIPTSTAPRT
jgi:hypothetical protein